MMKRIKVMMSSYNGEKYIEDQINSILDQVGVKVELFIRDDGSFDETMTILDTLESVHPNIHVDYGKNIGPSESFMELLYTQDGAQEYDYYAFSDQDDIWQKDKLKRAVDVLEKEKSPALYYSALSTFKEQSKEKKLVVNDREYTFAETFFQSHYPGCTMVINAAGIRLIRSIKKPTIVIMHDIFVAQVFIGTKNQVVYDRESRINYRIHGNNVSVKKDSILGELKRYRRILDKQKGLRLLSAKEYQRVMNDMLDSNKQQILNIITGYKESYKKRFALIRMIMQTSFCRKIKCMQIIAVLTGVY